MNLVTIGGRSSALMAIHGIQSEDVQLTCILGVADSGSSTGVIRQFYDVPAMGDIRSAVAALAQRHAPESLVAELFEYRMPPSESPVLTGLAIGNIVIGALTLQRGRISEAVTHVMERIPTTTRVLPVSDDPLILTATLDDGSEVSGEVNVRGLHKPAIASVGVAGTRSGLLPEARQAILEADLIVLGPGCLYTSVIAALITPGMPDTLAQTHAAVVWIANTTTTPGQTDGLSLGEHARILAGALRPARLNVALVQSGQPSETSREAYRELGLEWLELTESDRSTFSALGIRPLFADTIESPASPRTLHKLDTIRHDPTRTMEAILGLRGRRTADR